MELLSGDYENLSKARSSSPSDVQADPEKKVIDEIYEALLPAIIECWEEKPEPSKPSFLTASSEVSFKDASYPPATTFIKFKSGNTYTGYVQNMRLHGEGVYRWADGSFYEGLFNENRMEGEGKIEYSCGARYIGQVSYGYHHGDGLFISDNLKYGGKFDSGMFHGKGDLKTAKGNFCGNFNRNKIHEGVRVYEDGVFSGTFTIFGERSKGRFLFGNGDTYNGSWHEDQFCDFGIYRWNPSDKATKRNKFLVPNENYFMGYWADSYRFGFGVLHFDDKIIYNNWKFDHQIGPGFVIASNGEIFVDEHMFSHNSYRQGCKIVHSKEADQCVKDLRDLMKKILRDTPKFCELPKSMSTNQLAYDVVECNMANVCELSLRQKVKELVDFSTKIQHPCSALFLPKYSIELKSTPIIDFVATMMSDVDRETLEYLEIKSINQVVLDKLSSFEELYVKYAQYGLMIDNDGPIYLIRLGLWRFFKTICNFNLKLNIMDCIDEAEDSFHILSQDLNNPTEIIYFWQFLKYVLYLTMIMNRDHTIADEAMIERPKYFGLFATMLLIFLREHDSFEPLAVDNLPKMIVTNVKLVDAILDYIMCNFQFFTFRKSYAMLMDFCEKSRLINDGVTYLNFDDFIMCAAQVHPYLVRDNILVHIDVRLSPLEFFEIFILLVNKEIRNKKYSLEETKFLKTMATKMREEEAEEEAARLVETPPPAEEPKSKKSKRKGKK